MSVINPPGLSALFSSGCICSSGATQAAGVNVPVKNAGQLPSLKVQEGGIREFHEAEALKRGQLKMDPPVLDHLCQRSFRQTETFVRTRQLTVGAAA